MIGLKNSRMGKLDPQLSAYKAKVLLGVSMYTWLVFKLHTILYARERRLSRHFESVWYNFRKSGLGWGFLPYLDAETHELRVRKRW